MVKNQQNYHLIAFPCFRVNYMLLIILDYNLENGLYSSKNATSMCVSCKAQDLSVGITALAHSLYLLTDQTKTYRSAHSHAVRKRQFSLPGLRNGYKECFWKGRIEANGTHRVDSALQHMASRLQALQLEIRHWASEEPDRGAFTSEFTANEQSILCSSTITLLSKYYIWKRMPGILL